MPPDSVPAVSVPAVSVRPAEADDRQVLDRLWPLFQHDLSEWRGLLPAADGTFRSERLHAAFDEPDWTPYLFTSDGHPSGFALVRGITSPSRVLSAFFVVRGARRAGVGLSAVREVIGRHPGPWEIPFQDVNVPAARFWRRAATDLAGPAWTESRRSGRPDLPPDTWIAFTTG